MATESTESLAERLARIDDMYARLARIFGIEDEEDRAATPDQFARAVARNLVAKKRKEAVDILAQLVEATLYLDMKAEWSLEDQCGTAETVAELLGDLLPGLSDGETVAAASYFDLDADELDDPYYDAHNRAMERTEED